MTKRIALVGCGNVGSFHLLACTHISDSCHIDVVEPNKSSVETAKIRIKDVLVKSNGSIQVNWLSDISEIKLNAAVWLNAV